MPTDHLLILLQLTWTQTALTTLSKTKRSFLAGSPVVRILCFIVNSLGSISGWGIKISAPPLPAKKKKQKRNVKTNYYYYFFFQLCHAAYGILVPQPGIEPMPSALGAQILNYWTIREVPTPILKCLRMFSSVQSLSRLRLFLSP